MLRGPSDMPDCLSLAIKDMSMDGNNVMVSAWQPTPDEMQMLLNGGSIHLHIWGDRHPPVFVGVSAP